ncbi:MAG TPA: hypothetical protein VF796_18850 [Humisphaera sp.]
MSKQPLIENLEERRHLSASLLNGTLTVGGTTGNDTITITSASGKLTAKVNAETRSFTLTAVKKIVVNAGKGNDTVNIAASVTKPAVINGSDGNDKLTGGGGSDVINGGAGNDTETGGGGKDTFNGGTGTDTVSYASYSKAVKVSLDGVPNDGAAGEGDDVETDVENVTGGSGDDTLAGDDDANVLSGGAGADTLLGEGGKDVLNGGTGADDLEGDAGDDDLNGGDGNDDLDGGTENDDLDGGNGDDVLDGAAGTNVVKGGAGLDRFRRSGGVDTLSDRQSDEDEEADEDDYGISGASVRLVTAADPVAGTITVAPPSGESAATPVTLPVDPAAVLTVDGKPATVGQLVGLKVLVKVTDGPTPTVTSVVAVGAKIEGKVVSTTPGADPTDTTPRVLPTITLGGHEGRPGRTVTLALGATITKSDGTPATFADVVAGAEVKLTLSAADPTTAVAVVVKAEDAGDGEDDGDGVEGKGTVASVDAVAGTITLNVQQPEGLPAVQTTFTVSPTAKIKVDGQLVTLASLANLLPTVKVEFHSAAAAPTVLTELEAEGTSVKGITAAVDATAGTISLKSEGGPVVYNVSPTAKVLVGGVAKTLADVPVNGTVELRLSAFGPTLVIGIKSTLVA